MKFPLKLVLAHLCVLGEVPQIGPFRFILNVTRRSVCIVFKLRVALWHIRGV